MRKKVANAILAVIDSNGLIRADSGPWEHHLQNVKQYAFTSSVCAEGLKQFAELQKKLSLPYSVYEKASERIKNAILKNLLVDRRFIKGNANDKTKTDREYYDGGVFEMFANGLVIDKNLFHSHIDEYNKVLRIRGDRDGYIRMNTDDVYENQEWAYLDLRIARAYVFINEKEKAKKMIDYVTKQAALNNNHIPEMYSYIENRSNAVKGQEEASEVWCNCIRKENEDYIGAIPMVGYGSAAYIISLYDYYEKK